ncbi:hypothetical protein ACTXT7_010574 [Hymenolepis weldensis]
MQFGLLTTAPSIGLGCPKHQEKRRYRVEFIATLAQCQHAKSLNIINAKSNTLPFSECSSTREIPSISPGNIISSFGFYHPLNSTPKATDYKLSSIACSGYLFHERRGFGIMEMLINFLFNHAPPHPTPKRNSAKD